MGFRIPLGGGDDKRGGAVAGYTEGFNAGYQAAMARPVSYGRGPAGVDQREATGHWPLEEDRRGRPRSTESHWPPEEDRRGRPRSAEGHWPSDGDRRIGFGRGDERGADDEMMAMLRDIRKGQEHIMRGMAEAKSKLDPRLDGVLETAVQVLEHPPLTWASHLKNHDFAGIAKMEGKELLAALEAKKPMKDIRKELTHTIAALFQMVAEQ